MVRPRVELRRIEDKGKRSASFSKRHKGLLKKARELAVLCDAEVALIVFSPTGKLSHFSSNSSIETTLQRYNEFSDAERNVKKCALEMKVAALRLTQGVGMVPQERARGNTQNTGELLHESNGSYSHRDSGNKELRDRGHNGVESSAAPGTSLGLWYGSAPADDPVETAASTTYPTTIHFL